MRVLLEECVHFLSALLIGITSYAIFGQWWLILVSLAFGFLIDVDHLFDYFNHFGVKKFVWREFLEVKTYMLPSGRVFVLFHGWEYLLLFWLLASLTPFSGLRWAVVGPYLFHLTWDNFSYPHHILFYFLIFRIIKKFNLKRLMVST